MAVRKLVAVDIGSRNIHIVEGRKTENFVELEKGVIAPTPSGAFKDGKIDDENILKGSLQAALNQNRITTRNIVITIHSSSVITRELLLPVSDPGQLGNMVKYEIEQYLPIVSSEYVIEYKVVEEFMDDNIKKMRIQVAAMPRDIAAGYFRFLKSMGLKPTALDIHSNSIAKLFAGKFSINDENYSWDRTAAVIDMGHLSINTNIISKGRIQFSRSISSGGRELDRAIATNFNLSLERAEKRKINEVCVDPDDVRNTSDDLNILVKAILEQWLAEIQKIFQYYLNRNKENKIDTVYLYGGGSNLKGLEKYMEEFLNIHTVKIENISYIRSQDNSEDFRREYFLNAAGSMIRY